MSVTKFSASLTQVLAPTNYTALSNPIYKRVPTGSILLCLSGSGLARVLQAKDSYTATWNLAFTNQGNAFDDNLSTNAYYSIAANTAETVALNIDYNSVTEKYLLIRLQSSYGNGKFKIYTSSDGVNWSLLLTAYPTTATTYLFRTTFRYLRVAVYNDTASSDTVYIYEIATFSVANAIYTKNITYADRVVIDEIQCNPYWLWVEPSPTLNVSIYERVTPSSASEVWIL